MLFSERNGYVKTRQVLQKNEMDERLRNRIWNEICAVTFDGFVLLINDDLSKKVSRKIQSDFLGLPTDDIDPFTSSYRKYVKERFFDLKWHGVYSFVEFIIALEINEQRSVGYDGSVSIETDRLVDLLKPVLVEERSAYRFVGKEFIPITNETELAEIEQAVEQTQSETVSKHLGKAVSFYSNRENPDYPNAITESIKAVEEAARLLTGDKNATLGGAIKKLKADGRVHSAFADGVSKLFGWTSDTMRHAAKGQAPEIGEAEARFMLVNCSAMANYLLSLLEANP